VTVLIAAAAAGLAGGAYHRALPQHPGAPSRTCGGGGKSRDRIWRGAFGTCKACGGRGRHPRLGVRVLQPGRHKRLTGSNTSHKRADGRR
jgi:hypothetical protein